MTTTTQRLSSVLYLSRWVRCNLSLDELAAVRERIEMLPDQLGGRLTAANLDAIPLKTRGSRWWRLKVPPFRVFFIPAGDEVIVAELDRRSEDTFKDLQRLDRYLILRSGQGVRVLVAAEPPEDSDRGVEPVERQRRTPHRELQNPLSPFTSAQLRDLGLGEPIVELIRTLGPGVEVAGELAAREVDAEVIEVVAAAWHDPQRVLAIFDHGRVPSADELVVSKEELAERVSAPDSSTSLAPLDDAALQAVLEGTVEEWMFYLHSSQLRIVEADPTGPSRVRGGPGTGKTVAALHRARWLARTGRAERVLVTTFVSLLPRVWDQLYGAFAPDVRDRITTATVDSLARRLVEDAGGVVETVVNGERRGMLERALLGAPGAKEALAGGPEVLGAEIDTIIAGRGLDEAGYLAASRRGRGRGLSPAQRGRVWAAYQAYLAELERSDKTDWAHLRLEAWRLAAAGAGPRFDAVVVDEAQDLTEVHLRLLLALHEDEEHRALLLVGDGQQAIYPGGYTLRSLGLDVRGRSHLLRTNWRNTQLIWNAAETLMRGVPFGDLEDEVGTAPPAEQTLPRRLGELPQLHLTANPAETQTVLAAVVEGLVARYAAGDVAILCPTNNDADAAARAVSCETLDLRRYKGGPTDQVRVGTYARSKGLEFKAVIVVGPTAAAMRKATWMYDDPADKAEAEATWTRTLFVAMTRARDELVLIANGRLADALEAVREEFDIEQW